MKECALRGYDEDPFIIKTFKALERRILESTGLVPDCLLPQGKLPPSEDAQHPQLRTQGRNKANETARARGRMFRLLICSYRRALTHRSDADNGEYTR